MAVAKVILAYVPVLHQGYISFFERHRDAESLYIFGTDLIEASDYLRKEIRALNPVLMCVAIMSLVKEGRIPEFKVGIADFSTLQIINRLGAVIVMPDEDACRILAKNQFTGSDVIFDSIFLRWDRKNIHSTDPVTFDREIPFKGFVAEIMNLAIKESEKASSWWRQVGGVIVRGREILLSGHNRHMPSSHSPYADSDPRNAAKRGVSIELSTDCHIERRLISEAARRGIALEGVSLFITTFPCPPCGMAIAHSGIKRLYFLEGYTMVDSERILKTAGVEIIHVTK